ncbi:MAG TPA: zinc ribbon domain-containing protein, partial [Ignavibacteriales bacterium]|nr:zinc ribbon domain-containing protein [Ignavibacteriales bacterium]
MPIFEYQCNDCKKTFDVLHKSLSNMEEVKCPSCGSSNYKKLLSTFSASVSNGPSYSFGDHSCESG